MVGKFKLMVMFVAVVGVACIVLNFSGMNADAYAQDTPTAKSKECPLDKGGKCASDTSCKKKSKCDKGGSKCISTLLKLTRCAKKR